MFVASTTNRNITRKGFCRLKFDLRAVFVLGEKKPQGSCWRIVEALRAVDGRVCSSASLEEAFTQP